MLTCIDRFLLSVISSPFCLVNVDTGSRGDDELLCRAPAAAFRGVFNLSNAGVSYEENVHSYVNLSLLSLSYLV